jgi:hypothetical protein
VNDYLTSITLRNGLLYILKVDAPSGISNTIVAIDPLTFAPELYFKLFTTNGTNFGTLDSTSMLWSLSTNNWSPVAIDTNLIGSGVIPISNFTVNLVANTP